MIEEAYTEQQDDCPRSSQVLIQTQGEEEGLLDHDEEGELIMDGQSEDDLLLDIFDADPEDALLDMGDTEMAGEMDALDHSNHIGLSGSPPASDLALRDDLFEWDDFEAGETQPLALTSGPNSLQDLDPVLGNDAQRTESPNSMLIPLSPVSQVGNSSSLDYYTVILDNDLNLYHPGYLSSPFGNLLIWRKRTRTIVYFMAYGRMRMP